MDSAVDASWSVKERVIWDYELLYLMEGELTVTVEDRSYHGQPGDVFIFLPKQRHSIRAAGGSRVRQPHVHFDLTEQEDSPQVMVSFKMAEDMTPQELQWFRSDELSTLAPGLPSQIRLQNPRAVEAELFALIHELEAKPPFYEIRAKSLLLQLLTLVLREHHWNRVSPADNRLETLLQMQNYIHSNVHRYVSLDELSEAFHISKFYLIHLFKEMFHLTPIQYHQKVRLERAKNMIRHTPASLQQIAEQLGFANIHAFSRAFKTKEGISPSQYRSKGL
jgi:AraC-like DNA-binding protein